jgi:hypothetical protein
MHDSSETKERLLAIVNGESEPETLPETWTSEPYVVPAAIGNDVKFNYVKLDSEQLAEEIKRNPCLWDQFDLKFRSLTLETTRRPLRAMSNWHLALALAAGQVSGVVGSQSGQRFLIKGGTHKEKVRSVSQEVDEENRLTSTTVLTDRFVPVIRAIDFTPGDHFGRVVEIR